MNIKKSLALCALLLMLVPCCAPAETAVTGYDHAAGLLVLGEYQEAYEGFHALAKENYDAEAEKKLGYEIGTKAESAGDLATAYACYAALETLYGGYSDSSERLKTEEICFEGRYALAMRDVDEEKYGEAYALFAGLLSDNSSYRDVDEKECLLRNYKESDEMKKVGENLIAYSYKGLWGLIDLNKNTASKAYWDSIGAFAAVTVPDSDTPVQLAKVSKDGKYGYVDPHGDEHVQCIYDSISDFDSLGLTLACRNGQYGYLNTEKYTEGNNAIVPVEFDAVSGFDADTGICRTSKIIDNTRFYGMYRKDGTQIAETEWKAINTEETADGIQTAPPRFISERIQVCNGDGKWILMDTEGSLQGNEENYEDNFWDQMGEISEERVSICRDGKWGFINLYNELKIGGYVDADGTVVVGSEDDIISDGQKVEPVYEEAYAFSNGMAVVKLDGKYGYVDPDGNLKKIGFRFDQAENFDGESAFVSVEDSDDEDNRGAWMIGDESEQSMFISIADCKEIYQNAKTLQEQADNVPADDPEKYSKYEEALKDYDSLNGYEDSFERKEACGKALYDHALELRAQGEFEEPIRIFGVLDSYHYPKARKQMHATYYKWGLVTRNSASDDGKVWANAASCFENAGLYNPSAEKDIEVISYIKIDDGFDQTEDMKAASEQILRTYYLQGMTQRNAQAWEMPQVDPDWAGISECFVKAGSYAPKNAANGQRAPDEALKTWYMAGIQQRGEERWDDACASFGKGGEYTPQANDADFSRYQTERKAFDPEEDMIAASEQAERTHYLQGMAMRNSQVWETAQEEPDWAGISACFVKAGDYAPKDSANGLIASDEALKTWYMAGIRQRGEERWDDARASFGKSGEFTPGENDADFILYETKKNAFDSAEDSIAASVQILRTWYLQALSERRNREWDSARSGFEQAGEYTPVNDPDDPEPQGGGLTAEEQISKTWYLEGLLDKRPAYSWDEARNCFQRAGNYDPNREKCVEFADSDPLGMPYGRYLPAQTQVYETTYQEAKYVHDAPYDTEAERMEALSDAHSLYVSLIYASSEHYTGGYDGQFVDNIIINDTEMTDAVRKAWTTVGNTVKFGVYEQDGDKSSLESIVWKVLDTKDGDAMILTRDCLEPMAFYGSRKPVTWADSIPREWLEKEFMPAAFTDDQIRAIRLTEVSNSRREATTTYYGAKGSPRTFDRFFLLSYAEVMRYMPEEEDRTAEATAYAQQRGAYAGAGGDAWWWLRTPGTRSDTAAGVTAEGETDRNYVDSKRNSVRPACWVDVESVIYPASLIWPEKKQIFADDSAVMHHSGDEEQESGTPDLKRKDSYPSEEE